MNISKFLTLTFIILLLEAAMIMAETNPPGILVQETPNEGISGGSVIAFGKIIEPPYYITTVDDKVLINGIVFFPREKPPVASESMIKVSTLDTHKYNIIKSLKNRYLDYYTKHDQEIIQELLQNEFLKYPVVSSLKIVGNDIRLEFSDGDYELMDLTSYLTAGQEKVKQETELKRQLNDEAANVASCLTDNGMISFGYKYTTYIPENIADSIKDIIDKLSSAEMDSATAVDMLMKISGRREFIDDITLNHIQ
ncbi:MAG: hypothetical protein AB1746_01210 [Candidatus Zixiibacteriota bacterium]